MSTSIEWTATVQPDGTVTPGSTWNPVTGCSKVSPGCAHCYAEDVAKRFWKTQYPPVEESFRDDGGAMASVGRPRVFTDVQCHEDRLDQPLRWKKPRKVFVNSMSDLFHEDVPDAFIDRVFAVMALALQHTFQILTKRAERMREYLKDPYRLLEVTRHIHARLGDEATRSLSPIRWPLPNVWMGVSCENQHFADERIPLLLQAPSAVRFISAEPLLGPVSLHPPADRTYQLLSKFYGSGEFDPAGSQPVRTRRADLFPKLDWVIVGGESGQRARPFRVQWARSILQQCQAAGVPVFVKQLGALTYSDDFTDLQGREARGPNRVVLRDRKGGDPSEWPSDIRVREFPGVR